MVSEYCAILREENSSKTFVAEMIEMTTRNALAKNKAFISERGPRNILYTATVSY